MKNITRDFIYSNIDKIMANADKLSSKEKVNIKELLNDKFLRSETKFNSVYEIFAHFGKENVSEAIFSEIDDRDWNEFIHSETDFEHWDDMLEKATNYYVTENLFRGIKQE